MRKTLNIVLGMRPSNYATPAFPYLVTLICIQVKAGWREWAAGALIGLLLLVPYAFGYSSGREEVTAAFDKRFDAICDTLPWPRPADCARFSVHD